MKEEFLEVYSPEGTKTGQKKSKSEIHRKGLFHSTVHVWIFTDEGNILIQKRSKKKELNPGVWDVSVAGHIKFNENIKKAAKRETLEETGININTKDLLKIGVYRSINIHPTAIDKEFFHTYILKIDKNSINLGFKNNEVDDLKFISIEEMESLIKEENNKIFIGKNRKYYSDVLKSIKFDNYQ
ncbi:MAG: NUDIX hydrolase [Flavobacteriales bacterium]|jgi:isopentenyldiphosphate isomerase|nr:MAG: NUDIX hydrolase [Flavobacteriales bacterium]|tara:strand:- start:155 stop:706 length:552 start_codon:yes stop_codon:yes gene_type:complete